MQKFKSLILLIALFILSVNTHAFSAKKINVHSPWNIDELSQVPDYKIVSKDNGVYGIIYKGAMYNGEKSDVFAYYCTPGILKGDCNLDKNLPGVVCVHGGGGKAFKEWAKLWAEKGFAAISMDLRGYGSDNLRLPNGFFEPNHQTPYFACYADSTKDWFFQAVSNVVYAHSLILSFKEVNPQKTAITGVSWGGIITTLVSGLDARFKVACPVYGCGFLYKSGGMAPKISKEPMLAQEHWKQQYDPSLYVKNAKIPILFVNGTNDAFFYLDQYAETYKLAKNHDVSLRVGLIHGHQPAWLVPEVQNYIAYKLNLANTLAPVQFRKLKIKEGKISACLSRSVKKSFLNYTTDSVIGPTSKWIEKEIVSQKKRISSDVPTDFTALFLSIEDEKNNRNSSELIYNK